MTQEAGKVDSVQEEVGINSTHRFNTVQSDQVSTQASTTKTRRVKRVVHCSDGVYEEYSSDEEGVYPVNMTSPLVDPKTMPWLPWIGHISSKALAACDYVGESLADLLGITGPKYRYEIEEARRMQEEEDAAKKATDLEMAGWNTRSPPPSSSAQPSVTSTPVSILSVQPDHPVIVESTPSI